MGTGIIAISGNNPLSYYQELSLSASGRALIVVRDPVGFHNLPQGRTHTVCSFPMGATTPKPFGVWSTDQGRGDGVSASTTIGSKQSILEQV